MAANTPFLANNPMMGGHPGGWVNGKVYYDQQSYNNAMAAKSYTEQQQAMQQKQQQVAQKNQSDTINSQYGNIYADATNRQQSDFRNRQNTLADVLEQRAQGKNLLSTELLRQGADRNIQQQMAMAASARPGQVGMAQRLAAQNAGNINAGLAGQQTLAGLQEQAQAQGMLAGVIGQGRGQDLQFTAQNDATRLGATGGQGNMYNANMANETQRYGIDQQVKMNAANQPAWWERAIGAAVPILGIGAGIAGKPSAPGGFSGGGQLGGVLDNSQFQGVRSNPYTTERDGDRIRDY